MEGQQQQNRGRQNNNRQPRERETVDGLIEKVLEIRRVSRKTVGGNHATFSVLMAVGDGKGMVGLGLANAGEVPQAIAKAAKQARKHILRIKLEGTSIPYDILIKENAAKILLKPAPKGTGLKVGGVIRPIMELAGVKDVSGKIFGSHNKINLANAIYQALTQFKNHK
ncbi:MAG: 30S ribosomal protein S5 [Patescibacteria group bacterium]|jgi:small subunit ribosomal protein S5